MPGHRNMYYATGLPGWMRFGFSPGWAGRSPAGLGPCATYLMTGAWGMPTNAYRGVRGPAFVPWQGGGAPFMNDLGDEDELSLLKQQAEWLSAQMEEIGKRIQELEDADRAEQ